MKLRSDSPFAKIDREDWEEILEDAEFMSMDDLTERIERVFKVEVSRSAVQRFVARLRAERLIEEAKDRSEDLQELAEVGKSSASREATMEVARQKLFDVATKSEDAGQLTEVVKALSEEKAREHELTMRERAMKVAEENAKLGWRKLELLEARSALRLLPQVLQVVTSADGTADERLARVREMLIGATPQKVLIERTQP